MEVDNAMKEERSREEYHVDQEILEEKDNILKGQNMLSRKKSTIHDSFDSPQTKARLR